MHRDLLTQGFELCFVAGGLKRNQNGNFAHRRRHRVVHVASNHTVRYFQHGGTAQVHVLTNGRNLMRDFVSNIAA